MYYHDCVPMTDDDSYNLISSVDDHLRAPDLDDHEYYYFQNYYNNNVETVDRYNNIDSIVSYWDWEDDEKARVGGTLESIVDQATHVVSEEPLAISVDDNITSGTTMSVNNAMVPLHLTLHNTRVDNHDHLYRNVPDNTWEIGHRTNGEEKEECYMANEAADINNYAFEPFTCKEGWMTTFDNHQEEDDSVFGVSLSNTSNTIQTDHNYHPLSQIKKKKKVEKRGTTISRNKRSKATILHNKAEQKRRNKINQRMEALRKLVPNICYKTDKATMLDQVIEYIKKLQTQQNNEMMMMMIRNGGMMNNMSYPMMIPIPCYMFLQQQQQQQQRMSMMAGAQMGMGSGLGSMQTNLIMYPKISTGTRTRAIVHPTSVTPSNDS